MYKFFLLPVVYFSLFGFALQSEEVMASQQSVYMKKDFTYLLGKTKFSDDLLQMHFTLYEGYVKNVNLLLDQISQLSSQKKGISLDLGALKKRLAFEFDGMRLHELYFENMTGSSDQGSAKSLISDIKKQWGSFEQWRSEFIDTGMLRGVGWAVLCKDNKTGKLLTIWISDHETGLLADTTIILVMDAWEHAYITEYGLKREKYLETFFSSIDWSVAQRRYDCK
jgi:Fe-Mn family superoxide dismutase